MKSNLSKLNFNQLRETHPDRYQKADLAAFSAVESDPGRWATQRGPSEDSHVTQLVRNEGRFLGDCSCEGFDYNDGPCSHLCGLHRLYGEGLINIPAARIRTATVDVPGEDQQLAHYTDQETAADGGRRRADR